MTNVASMGFLNVGIPVLVPSMEVWKNFSLIEGFYSFMYIKVKVAA